MPTTMVETFNGWYVLSRDYDSLQEELVRCQARIGELEVQVQQWKERAALAESKLDSA